VGVTTTYYFITDTSITHAEHFNVLQCRITIVRQEHACRDTKQKTSVSTRVFLNKTT